MECQCVKIPKIGYIKVMESKITYVSCYQQLQHSLPALYENVQHFYVVLFYSPDEGVIVLETDQHKLGQKIKLLTMCFDENEWTRLPDGTKLTLVQKSI